MRTTRPVQRYGWTFAATALLAVVLLVAGQLGAAAAAVPFDRGIDAACEDSTRDLGRFADVPGDHAHAESIDCLSVYGVVQGRFEGGENLFDSGAEVTREQMASFVALVLDLVPDTSFALPEADGGATFDDAEEISAAHRRNVHRLQQAGIVAGYADGTFRPGVEIGRAQMATFVSAAIEAVIDAELPGVTSPYDDVAGTHGSSILQLTQAGIVQGTSRTTYSPAASTTRGQMATMLARTLDYLVAEGHLEPVEYAPAGDRARLTVTDVDVAAHDGFDRVTFTLAGDGEAGWKARYVDRAVAAGSGHEVEVAGDAVLQLDLTGMALPGDLDEEFWDTQRVDVGGRGIVEIVNQTLFEGGQQLFIGTSGVHGVAVERLTEPQRVYVDVAHRP